MSINHEPNKIDTPPEEITIPDRPYDGFESKPPTEQERVIFDQERAAVRDRYVRPHKQGEKKLLSRRNILVGGGALAVAAATFFAGGRMLGNNEAPQEPGTAASEPASPSSEVTTEPTERILTTEYTNEQLDTMTLEQFFATFQIPTSEYSTPKDVVSAYYVLLERYRNAGGLIRSDNDSHVQNEEMLSVFNPALDGIFSSSESAQYGKERTIDSKMAFLLYIGGGASANQDIPSNPRYKTTYKVQEMSVVVEAEDTFQVNTTIETTDNSNEIQTWTGQTLSESLGGRVIMTDYTQLTFVVQNGNWVLDGWYVTADSEHTIVDK